MFKNKLIKGVLVATAVSATLLLTACGDSANNTQTIEIAEFVPDATFLASDVVNLTNQEAFDLMIESPAAIRILLEMVDYALLSEDFEINTDNTIGFWNDLSVDITDLDEWFIINGFPNEAYVIRYLNIFDLRIAAARDLAEIDEDTIQMAFDEWYGHTDYELEDKYDEIRDLLLDQAAGQLSGAEILRLRAEGELEIFNETLATIYEEFLVNIETEVTLATATSEVDDNVIARINGVNLTIDELFHHLSNEIGMSIAFEQIDNITTVNYSVDPADVDEQIDEVREMFGDDFYEVIESVGFDTVEDLFDYFADYLLDQVIVRAHRTPTEEELQALYAQMSESAGASHILVNTVEREREEALELVLVLIERLQAASADEFADLFAELAAEYSNCSSGVQSGGDLGVWERGRMVPEFDNAVFEELAVGEFTLAPVWNPHHNGYHIIYKTYASVVQTFEEAHDDLVSHFINSQLQMGALEEIRMELRLATNLHFENPTLQTRFEFITTYNED